MSGLTACGGKAAASGGSSDGSGEIDERDDTEKLGWKDACRKDPSLALGLNVVEGKVVYPGVAEAFSLPLSDPNTVL